MHNARSSLTARENEHVGNVDVIWSTSGPDDFLSNVISDEWFRVGIDGIGFGLVAAESHDRELGLDHAWANLSDTNRRRDQFS